MLDMTLGRYAQRMPEHCITRRGVHSWRCRLLVRAVVDVASLHDVAYLGLHCNGCMENPPSKRTHAEAFDCVSKHAKGSSESRSWIPAGVGLLEQLAKC